MDRLKRLYRTAVMLLVALVFFALLVVPTPAQALDVVSIRVEVVVETVQLAPLQTTGCVELHIRSMGNTVTAVVSTNPVPIASRGWTMGLDDAMVFSQPTQDVRSRLKAGARYDATKFYVTAFSATPAVITLICVE